jgi:hypothetical protein
MFFTLQTQYFLGSSVHRPGIPFSVMMHLFTVSEEDPSMIGDNWQKGYRRLF